jgi:PAS domain S-box-containing protein
VKITEQYEKINELVPQSIYATNLYFGFLVNSGVDVRATIKMKEKLSSILETRTKNAKISNEEINEDEEMSIITLDTIGNNLGVVLNSNSHVRELLGFEKTALLGKNITKLMPKIYTELHNAFMLNFIRSENSHQRSSTKFVTALNRHSLLVEINLSVRILNSTQSDLAIVGFMKRINAEPYRGLVMYSATNGEVLGIDENFVEMMNKRLTGKQVAQEEIRLAVLAPELNMELLEKELEQETLLEVGSSLEEEGDLEVQKKIRVHLKKLKIYEGVKLGFLEIVDLSHFQTANKKLLTDISSKIANLATKHQLRQQRSDSLERSMETAVRNNRRKLTEDLSINLSQSQRALNESAIDGLNRELPTARRL